LESPVLKSVSRRLIILTPPAAFTSAITFALLAAVNRSPRYICVAGQTVTGEATILQDLFEAPGRTFSDRSWLENELQKLEASGYEDDTASVVAKLLKP
jgi:hypothetical protein